LQVAATEDRTLALGDWNFGSGSVEHAKENMIKGLIKFYQDGVLTLLKRKMLLVQQLHNSTHMG
jgi:hypothetical protein